MGAPMLISAGSLWQGGKLRRPQAIKGANIALDSAGFVAMTVHGGCYPWDQSTYLDLVQWLNPVWYASRDYCVEPQIAQNELERDRRIHKTAQEYHLLCEQADQRGLPRPMPVLQGWTSKDYIKSARLIEPLPQMIGIGSVCRRPLSGPSGLSSILDCVCELGSQLHLFGVKGSALKRIKADLFWRLKVKSIDSHAWDYGARMQGVKTLEGRMRYLRKWYRDNTSFMHHSK